MKRRGNNIGRKNGYWGYSVLGGHSILVSHYSILGGHSILVSYYNMLGGHNILFWYLRWA
jgi:hypothetical protein